MKQEHGNRSSEGTTNDGLIHNTTTSSAIQSSSDYGGYDSGSYSSSCSSHSSYDSGSSFDSSSSCD
ncbi:hypothetical protein [Bacillus cereus]|uniref:hypothetical protein n=1 Tax=Bacillus cereus TaxID=1396 RepID=UPI0018F35568|nr:hypothetical protein [Bacillus cereus]MBJ8038101.1 hypothetical protein [Bacillus cereus]